VSQPEAKNWIDLGDWGHGMDGFKLPSSSELAGKEIKLRFNTDNLTIAYTFHDAGGQLTRNQANQQMFQEEYHEVEK
jgi:hypothetical protein